MKTATIQVSKIITVITENMVYCAKNNSFESVIKKFDVINFRGLLNPSKKAKYEKMLLNAGYTANVVYCDNAGLEDSFNVLNFSIIFSKQ